MLTPSVNLQTLAEQIILQRYSPASVLTNDKGDILFISGRTGKYLEPAAGKANWNIFVMTREGLRYELANAFQKVVREKGEVTLRGVEIKTDGGVQTVDLFLHSIDEPEMLRGTVMIIFKDVPAPSRKKAPGRTRLTPDSILQITELEKELEQSRKELQLNREEMQTSQEELKATNEELQSTNEELQSTNEELTTSKEELQSLNEELQTVNAEQMAKVDELSWASNDMKNLLNSTEIVTIFLDNDLHLRRFTTGANKLFKLIPSDIGRPLTDIVTDLVYEGLYEDAREVLRSLVFSEKEIISRDGRWFKVRIMLYRIQENRIDGVVLTFVDITVAKKLEEKLRESDARLSSIINSAPNILLCLSPEGRIVEFNREAERVHGRNREQVLGRNYFELFIAEPLREQVAEEMFKALTGEAIRGLETPVSAADGGEHIIHWSINPMNDPDEQVTGIIALGREANRVGKPKRIMKRKPSHEKR